MGVEDIFGAFHVAGTGPPHDFDQHFRIGIAGHGAVGAAGELLRQEEPAIADQDREAPRAALDLATAQPRQLRQPRPILVLQHDDLRVAGEDRLQRRHREVDAEHERKVLQHDRHVRPQRGADRCEIAGQLLLRLEARLRRHHDTRGAGCHGFMRQRDHRRHARIADADDDGNAAGDAVEHHLHEGGAFLRRQLLRLAHHAENGEAGGAVAEIEVRQPRRAIEIERAVIGEGGGGNRKNAAGAGIKSHGILARRVSAAGARTPLI